LHLARRDRDHDFVEEPKPFIHLALANQRQSFVGKRS